jgi:hypothetical protein
VCAAETATSSARQEITESVDSKQQQQQQLTAARSCASGYVTVLEIGGHETVAAAACQEVKRVVSKSCSRAASLNRKKASEAADRSSSVPPSNGTVLVRIKSSCHVTGTAGAVAKPQRKQSIKIGSEAAVKPPLKRSSSANAEVRPNLAEAHAKAQRPQDKAVQYRPAEKAKVRHEQTFPQLV